MCFLLDFSSICADGIFEKGPFCSHCKKFFSNQQSLRRHLDRHNIVRKSYACPICGKVYSHDTSLYRHKILCHSWVTVWYI